MNLNAEQRGYMEKWKFNLRYGPYEQTRGELKNNYGYCCMGVAAEVMGHKFEFHDAGEFFLFVDDIGIPHVTQLGTVDAEKLGLDIKITEEESIQLGVRTGEMRQNYLIRLNDKGKSFDTIVDTIERLGWDR